MTRVTTFTIYLLLETQYAGSFLFFLQAVPDAIAGLEYLEELHLSSSSLVSLPDSIGLLLNLKILDVSANKLKSLPDSISKCRYYLHKLFHIKYPVHCCWRKSHFSPC